MAKMDILTQLKKHHPGFDRFSGQINHEQLSADFEKAENQLPGNKCWLVITDKKPPKHKDRHAVASSVDRRNWRPARYSFVPEAEYDKNRFLSPFYQSFELEIEGKGNGKPKSKGKASAKTGKPDGGDKPASTKKQAEAAKEAPAPAKAEKAVQDKPAQPKADAPAAGEAKKPAARKTSADADKASEVKKAAPKKKPAAGSSKAKSAPAAKPKAEKQGD